MWDQVFHHAERGIVVGSPDGDTLEMMNPAFPLMFGYTLEELAGKPLIDIFAPEARAEVSAMLELVRRTGQHTFESVCVRKDGGTFPVLVDATSVKDAQGNVHHRAIRVQDTTLLKSTERALRADRTEAERANEAKSQFLSRMSHELRTPLNVILGFAQVMQLDELSGTQAESVGHILESGRHLLALIDEALDISQVESGHMALSLESVKVDEPVLEVLALLRQMAGTDGIRLFGGERDSDCYVIADRHRLKQVLMNLVANAIKYNVRGGYVRVECNREGPTVAISVSDTGIGFPEGSTDRLFSPFDRLGQEGGEVEGTGLGLSLSKALVEAMGGSITAAPNTEAGSVFTVRLRASERADPELEQPEMVAGGHGRPTTEGLVLYIEDNLANFRLVEQVLARRPGVRVLPAMQARMGLQLALDHQPDLILLDLHLPDMSGEETLQRLLRNPLTRSIPVVIASADATPRRLQRLLSLGARAYLTKPIDIRQLLETIDSLLLEGQVGRQQSP
jgi:PAS domain S-box-containing protein